VGLHEGEGGGEGEEVVGVGGEEMRNKDRKVKEERAERRGKEEEKGRGRT
jgi:hypothetical protein